MTARGLGRMHADNLARLNGHALSASQEAGAVRYDLSCSCGAWGGPYVRETLPNGYGDFARHALEPPRRTLPREPDVALVDLPDLRLLLEFADTCIAWHSPRRTSSATPRDSASIPIRVADALDRFRRLLPPQPVGS